MNTCDHLVCELIEKMSADDRKCLYEALGKYIEATEEKPKEEPCLKEHCPLCGGKLVIKRTIDDRTWLAACDACGATGLCGHREDGEDLPTRETLEYGKEMEEEDEEEECDDCDPFGDSLLRFLFGVR